MNRQILLASHPLGAPTEANFKLHQGMIPKPQKGEILVQTLYLSADPFTRGRLGGRPSIHPPIPLNQCIKSHGLGRVVESKGNFKAGDLVAATMDWAEYSILNEAEKVDLGSLPITAALGPLGMTGMTAYFGFLDLGQAKSGETVVISGAAGAVGQGVGQIAKILGCRVVGIAGSDAKVEFLTKELGFDAAVNYKRSDFERELSASCPQGIDVYFDNVGGEVTDSALKLINRFARIVLCGQISTYNLQEPDKGFRHFRTLIVKSATARGFIVWDYKSRFTEAILQMREWIEEGKMKWKETIAEGLENAPKAFLGLFKGENIGKQLIKI